MSWQAKTDFFGLATAANGLEVTESNENKTASTAEGHNEKGDVVAFEVFGETMSPSNSYVLGKDLTLSTLPKCGEPITGPTGYTGKKFTLGSITISTSAGAPPTIQATGEEIPASTTHSDCTYTFPSTTLKLCHHAQILWGAFTLGGEGCYLQQANYTAGGTISRATKDGSTVSFDVVDGKLEVQITIQQTSSTAPTLTAGTDWTITAPLTCSSPDADYPSWTATLSRYLEHDAQSGS